MTTCRRLLPLLLALAGGGCSGMAGPGYGGYYAGTGCPAGTVMICVPESLRGCRCGTLIVR